MMQNIKLGIRKQINDIRKANKQGHRNVDVEKKVVKYYKGDFRECVRLFDL